MTQSTETLAHDYARDLMSVVKASPSSYHAAAHVRDRLAGQGFQILDEAQTWDLVPGGRYVVVRDGAVMAFVLPKTFGGNVAKNTGGAGAVGGSGASVGGAGGAPVFRVIGAHTDSPAFKLAPKSDFTNAGAAQVGVEIYGGPLLNSWLDRELVFAGRLALRDGTTALASTGPVGRIPQLAIHLDRGVNDGLKLDKQRHTQPVVGLEPVELEKLLAQSAGVDPEDVLGHDIYTCAAQEPALFGAHNEFLASPRLDNLVSVHAGMCAIEKLTDPTDIVVLAAFDHEEVGSGTRSGACGPMLAQVTERIVYGMASAWGYQGEEHDTYMRSLAGSVCVSSDTGHAVHPNYPEHHDPRITPLLGRGPLLKLNAQQRYASDAVGAAVWAKACEDAGVAYQDFVSNNNMPCGSTIGPLTATRLGMTTVDVGAALWSMHSAREMIAVSDIADIVAVLSAFVRG